MVLKNVKMTKAGNQEMRLILGTCWTTFVFMSSLKSRCFDLKMSMLFWDLHHHTLTCEFAIHRAGSQLKIYCIFGRFRPVPEYSFQVTLIVTNCSKVTVYMSRYTCYRPVLCRDRLFVSVSLVFISGRLPFCSLYS